MKLNSALLVLPAVANAAFYSREQYESGEVHQMYVFSLITCLEAL